MEKRLISYNALLRAQAALQEQASALRAQIEAAQHARGAAIAKILALMADHGVTLDQLDSSAPTPSAGVPPAATPVAPPSVRKFSAKYRDALTGNAWSGNGETPSWLKRALAEGRSLDEFKV